MEVWVVTINEVIDCSVNIYSPKVFSTYEKAKKYFDGEVAEAKKDLPSGWTSDESKDYFEMYEDGYWIDNHSVISIDFAILDESA